jgi:hypothetical protein
MHTAQRNLACAHRASTGAPLSGLSLVSYKASCSTAATTPRPFARHAFDDLYDQDSVVGSDGIDGLNDEGDSDCFGS